MSTTVPRALVCIVVCCSIIGMAAQEKTGSIEVDGVSLVLDEKAYEGLVRFANLKLSNAKTLLDMNNARSEYGRIDGQEMIDCVIDVKYYEMIAKGAQERDLSIFRHVVTSLVDRYRIPVGYDSETIRSFIGYMVEQQELALKHQEDLTKAGQMVPSERLAVEGEKIDLEFLSEIFARV